MSETIRLANESDAPALHAMLQQAYASLLEHNIHFTITRASVEDVREVIRNESTFVLETPDLGITATVTIRFPWTPARKNEAPWPFIHWFAVNQKAKGQGYGRKDYQPCGRDRVTRSAESASGLPGNRYQTPWLTALYLRRGYEPFHTAINPLGVELVYLRKILNEKIYEAQEQKEYVRTIADSRIPV